MLAQTLLDVVPSYVLWAREQRRVRLKRENDPFRQEDAAVQFKKEQALSRKQDLEAKKAAEIAERKAQADRVRSTYPYVPCVRGL